MSITNKEKNFISAVVYLHNDGENAVSFFQKVYSELDAHFEKFELIAVNNACADQTMVLLHDWAKEIHHPMTVVNMSIFQSKEICMNAGLDVAIGDYVYEFDTVDMPYDAELIWKAYELSSKGNDIVSVCPKQIRFFSRLFYGLFNRNSHSAYQLRSAAFTIVTRRAINRVHATSAFLPYRKAAFAASGLKIENIEFEGKVRKQDEKFSLAVDSLILYTDAGVKISFGIAILMSVLTLLELIYAIVIFCTGHPIEGWTTTMLVITVSFTGLFGLLTIMIKYLSLILEMSFKKQKYFVESIEKIQNER